MAMALQQKYMAQESQVNRQQPSQSQRQRQPESQGRGYGNQQMQNQYDNQPRAQPYQGEQSYQAQPYSQRKSKKSFSQKLQG